MHKRRKNLRKFSCIYGNVISIGQKKMQFEEERICNAENTLSGQNLHAPNSHQCRGRGRGCFPPKIPPTTQRQIPNELLPLRRNYVLPRIKLFFIFDINSIILMKNNAFTVGLKIISGSLGLSTMLE